MLFNRLKSFFVLIIVLLSVSILLVLNSRTEEPKAPIVSIPKQEPIEPIVEEITRGHIIIIIDDFGYRNDEVSEGFLTLDADLTFAVIPGHKNSKLFSERADKSGYEIIIHMPMESTADTHGELDYILAESMTSSEIEQRVEKVISEFPEAAGLNNHQGSKATADKRIMNIVSNVLKRHGRYFVDSRTTSETVAEDIMRSRGVPTARRHVFLDNDDDINKIRNQLYKLVDKAESKGDAIGIGHVKKLTLQVLKEEIPKLKKNGFKFQFASFVVK